MDITPKINPGKQSITGYGGGGFKINGQFVTGSCLVFPDSMIAWNIEDASQITLAALQPILDAAESVELLLIGTGTQMQPIDPAIRLALKAKHIALDVMNTGAACRTYNVLLGEERKVAAALIAI